MGQVVRHTVRCDHCKKRNVLLRVDRNDIREDGSIKGIPVVICSQCKTKQVRDGEFAGGWWNRGRTVKQIMALSEESKLGCRTLSAEEIKEIEDSITPLGRI